MACAKHYRKIAAHALCDFGTEFSHLCRGERERSEKPLRKPECVDDFFAEPARFHVHERARGGVCVFLFLYAREVIREVFGHHQKVGSRFEPARFKVGIQLINRVERVVLNTRFGVNFARGKNIFHFCRGFFAALVAVGVTGQNRFVAAHKDVIHAPCVDRERFDFAEVLERLFYARFHLAGKNPEIPVKPPVFGRGVTVEAMHFDRFDFLSVRRTSDNVPSARSAEVDRKKIQSSLLARVLFIDIHIIPPFRDHINGKYP